ncbi:MAG: sensor histidine kinase [Chloroflexota bacterium]
MQQAGDGLNLRVWARPLRIEDRRFVIFTVRDTRDEQRRKALERVFFHDILNTAGIVSTYAQMLEIEPDTVESVSADLNSVTDRLINEIIAQRDLMRAENGELQVRFQPIDTQAFVEELAEHYRNHPVSDGRHIAVRGNQAAQLVTDEPLLGRVVGNMLKNALEASDNGTTVTVGCDHNTTHARFFVHNPAFMPRKVQLQVFQRSFSTKGAGRGLGTYSMRLLSEKYLNGTVSFVSTEEQGTTFYAEYPIESGPGS